MWQIVVTDNSYVPIGEVTDAKNQNYVFGLKKLPVCSFAIRTDHRLASFFYQGEGFIKAYKNGKLEFFGPIVTVEEVADRQGASLMVNAAGVAWFMTKRLVGKSQTGTLFSTLTDRAVIAQQLFAAVTAEASMGIIDNPAWAVSGSTTTYTAGPYRPLSECVNELANTLDGFDWEIKPIEPTTFNPTAFIGEFRASPLIGTSKPEAIFEFGVGRASIVSYRMQLTRDTQANAIYHLGVGNQAPKVQIDTDSVAAYRRLEDVISADIADEGLRDSLISEHVAIRARPRRVITFEPHVVDFSMPNRVPEFMTDYRIGDTIRGRAVNNGNPRFDAEFRVYGANVTVDANGLEAVGLTLVDE